MFSLCLPPAELASLKGKTSDQKNYLMEAFLHEFHQQCQARQDYLYQSTSGDVSLSGLRFGLVDSV